MRLVVLLMLLALPSCAADSSDAETPQPTGSVASSVPDATPRFTPGTSPTRGGDAGTTITGHLGADSVEGGCAYLETADGTRYEVIYPDGWTIRVEPVTLTNPDGEVVARSGASITVRGRDAREMGSICQIGPIFEAVEVLVGG